MQRICYSEFQKTLHFCLLGALVISMLMVSSCSSIRNTAYFSTLSKDTTIQQFVSSSFESKIQKNDYLSIVVSSLSTELDLKFNSGAVNSLPTGATENSFGFLVNEGGSVMLHFIGNLSVVGLTCKELQKKLENDLLPYLKEPIVKVGFLNKKITILGEITKPQIYYMQDEQISLVDLIVNSGDLKENANKSKIMIIRDEGSQKKVKYINLSDYSIFNSSWYYLHPNDIVYVTPNLEKYDRDERRRNLQTTLSLVASMASLLIIIINILIK